MLRHLTITHYALIEHLDMDWETGFSVITGETGAGKSIILGALNLLLGGRSDAKTIQTGQKKCTVEALFNVRKLQLQNWFNEANIDYDEDECIIRREVSVTGKSRAFINDSPVAVSTLKELGSKLIDIHSQHQNLLIQNENFWINVLDTIAQNHDTLAEYQTQYRTCKSVEHQLEQLQLKAQKGREELDYKNFILDQINEASLSADEQTILEEELKVLSHAEEIKLSLSQAHGLLQTDEMSISEQIRQACNVLHSVSRNFEEASTLIQRLESVNIELNDIEAELSQHAENIECDPNRLSYIEERLNTIYGLEQKHHVNSVEELLTIAQNLQCEINQYSSIDNDIDDLQKKLDELQKLLNAQAAILTDKRQKAAEQIIQELSVVLQELGMPNVHIEIERTPRVHLDSSGNDNIVFLFSANKNYPPQDVSKIASGGEIARLMLALKSIIAKRTCLPTILFDEIDTGVSGAMAQKMAQVMKQISNDCQVICITHLPQIASIGDHQFKVYKEDRENTTYSHIIPLDKEQRIKEIAHMLSGDLMSEAAYNNAKDLLAYN